MERAHLSDHFTFKKILLMTISPILMMVFTSLYSIVDGIFVSNFAGNDAFAGVNLIFPIIMIVGGMGFMFGTGGSALVSKLLGEKKNEEASRTFSLIVYANFVLGLIISTGLFFSIEPISRAMGSITEGTSEEMVQQAIIYGKILILGQSIFMLQNVFQSFLVVAERQNLGFIFTLAAGITNMALDALFIGVFHWGVIGAAFATILGYLVGGVGPLIYFIVKKDGLIHLTRCKFVLRPLLQSSSNGFSEFLSNISASIVSIVYNIQLLKYYGVNGVSAYGIIMYVSFIFVAIFIGYSIGMAPIVGFNYGAKNKKELQNVLAKSMIIIGITGIAMFVLSFASANLFSRIFARGNDELIELSTLAMRVFSISFLVNGFSIYISSFFTALNNGLISAITSLVRTLVCEIVFVLIMPLWFGGEGIWWSIIVAEVVSVILAFVFLFAYKNRYGYFKSKKQSDMIQSTNDETIQ